jgi:(p)ppGpp synthase/HD superfamily hydrolase
MNEADNSMLERAIETAVVAHVGQTDKNDEPYILHPLRVMFAVRERDGSASLIRGRRTLVLVAEIAVA